MQLKLEKSLLAINPSLVLPYCEYARNIYFSEFYHQSQLSDKPAAEQGDFLLDEKLGREWASGKVYHKDWFGPVKTSEEDSYRIPGNIFPGGALGSVL